MSDIKWTEDKTWDQVQEEICEYYAQQSKEFEEKWKEEQKNKIIKMNQERLDEIARKKSEVSQKEQIIGSALRKYEQTMREQGEITNEFTRRHLESQITAARWALALGMAATFLFKGQWIIWIVFIVIYLSYVKNVKEAASKADKNRKDFGKKK